MGNEPLVERLREQGVGAARERSLGVSGQCTRDAALLYTLLLLLFSGKDGKNSKVSNIYMCVYMYRYILNSAAYGGVAGSAIAVVWGCFWG